MMRGKLLVGAAALAAVLGSLVGYKIYQQKSQPPPKRKIVQLLISMREEFHLVFFKIAERVNKMTAMKGLTIQEFQLANPAITREMEEISFRLHQQAEITKQEFEQAVEEHYSKDKQVQYHTKMLQNDFNKAFKGVVPDILFEYPAYLDKSVILNTIQSLLTDKLQRVTDICAEKPAKSVLQRQLKADAIVDSQNRDQKMKQLGVIANYAKILEFVTAKYIRMDPSFKSRYEEITTAYQQKMQKLINQN